MNKLILFDLDGTLLTGGKENLFEQAIKRIYDTEVAMNFDNRGMTDYTILVALLKNMGWDEQQVEKAMPKLLKEFDAVHSETFDVNDYQLLPGVKELLERLKTLGCTLGLITGNLESRAQRTLEALGVWDYFSIGGYGSDPHKIRAELVKVAVKRAKYENRLDDVFVIGDTARDIEASHTAGVKNSVGVVNGFRDPKELKEAGARFVLDDFKDTDKVIKTLGLAPA